MVYQGSYDLRKDVDKLKNKTDELAFDYYININSPVVTYKDEVYTPSNVTATAYKSSRELTDFFDGVLDIWKSTDGGNNYTFIKKVDGHSITQIINESNITHYRVNLYDSDLNLLDRQTVAIVRTTKGGAGKGYDFVYYTTASTSNIPTPVGDITKLVGNYDEWLQRPKEIDASHPNVFMSYRTSDEDGDWGLWSTPVKYNSIGERGEDGEGLEMIFCRTEYADGYTLDPSTLDPVQTDDYVPTGWTDDQKGVSSQYCFEYVCMRTRETNGGKIGQWGKFTSPKLWATYSEDGEDAITVMLGNEAQLIAVDKNGSLKTNPLTITIPVYCYKGTSRVAGTIDISGISNTFSSKTKVNPTASNNGSVTLTVTSVPNQVTKDEPIAVTVDGKTITKYFTWSKIGDGKDGNAGGTFDFVYYTKNNDTAPTISSSTVIDNNTGRNVVNNWCARPTNTSEQYPYCFGAYRELDHTGTPTGEYSVVYLWAKYGADGRSVSEVVNYYASTTTATAPSKSATNTWKTNISQVTFNSTYKYLWNYEETKAGTTVLNSTTPITIAYYSTDGAKGDTGKGISSIVEYYAVNNSTTAPADSSFSTTVVTTTTSNKYLWNYELITYTDSTTYKSSKRIISTHGQTGAKGEDGEDGADGKGLEMIFCRTTTLNGYPSDPYNLNPVQTPDYVPSGWTDDQSGVTDSYPYEYVCMRTSDANGTWSKFTHPKLWAKFGEDGENGTDGNNITPNAVLTKNADNNLSDTTIGGISNQIASDYVPSELKSQTISTYSHKFGSGNYPLNFYKQGRMVTVNYNLMIKNEIPSTWTNICDVPNWAVPVNLIYILNIFANLNQYRVRITDTGQLQIASNGAGDGTEGVNVPGSATYLAKDGVDMKTTTMTFPSTTVAQGGVLKARVTPQTGELPNVPIYFRINGVLYKRQSIGGGSPPYEEASLNVNLNAGTYTVTAWYDGGNYGQGYYAGADGVYSPSQVTDTITVQKCTNPTITFGKDSAIRCWVRVMNSSYPLRNHDVTITHHNHSFIGNSDSNGYVYFNLDKYTGKSVSVTASISNTGRCDAKTQTGTINV